MKLVFCPNCGDVFSLNQTWRRCRCRKSGGRYRRDRERAVIGGLAQVLGIDNEFFAKVNFVGHSSVWWGGFEGDDQIARVERADGKGV